MNIVNGTRITFKRTRPNPLFQDWLEELHEEAKEKGSKLEPMLKEALSSISKYPLPLQSGAECAILKGFDKKLCLFLDNRLEIHKKSSTESTKECLAGSCSRSSVSDSQNSSTEETANEKYEESLNIKSSNPQVKKRSLPYKPAFRSGSYALLMVLIDLNENQSLNKEQIIVAAQKYCKEDINLEWKNMTRLIKRGLVKKSGKTKPQFSLTEEGFSVAKNLFQNIQSKHGVDDVVLNEDTINKDILYNNPHIIEVTSEDYAQMKLNKTDIIPSKNKIKNYDINPAISEEYTHSQVLENIFNDKAKENLVYDKTDIIELEPGFFDFVLLIDKNETSGLSKKNDPTITEFKKYPELNHEYRSLKVGDFTWIARHKVDKDKELVLPYVVERKRMDDLGASIKDGRFHEQKFRLRKCGLNNVIYLVEHHGSNKHVGLPMQSLMQALANTRVQDGFKVHITDSLSHSVRFLAMMSLRLIYEYKDKKLKGRNGEARDDILMTYEYFNRSSLKSKPLTVTETFIKLLLQLKGVSVEKALVITNIYKTPRILIEAYRSRDSKEGEMLLANLKFGELNRSIGPSLSKSIYQLFTFKSMN